MPVKKRSLLGLCVFFLLFIVTGNTSVFLDTAASQETDGVPPDAVLLIAPKKNAGSETVDNMYPVVFDHLAHEDYLTDCRDCHTRGLRAEGALASGDPHDQQNPRTCVGCHTQRMHQTQECAVCHSTAVQETKELQCAGCHVPVQALGGVDMETLRTESDARETVARQILDSRPGFSMDSELQGIPEYVLIGTMADEYEPVEFAHLQHVDSVLSAADDSLLAKAFHSTQKGLVCQSCHHNVPDQWAMKNPPECASCHSMAGTDAQDVPGLKAAYHRQCMSCHATMEIDDPANTDCSACHEVAQ